MTGTRLTEAFREEKLFVRGGGGVRKHKYVSTISHSRPLFRHHCILRLCVCACVYVCIYICVCIFEYYVSAQNSLGNSKRPLKLLYSCSRICKSFRLNRTGREQGTDN